MTKYAYKRHVRWLHMGRGPITEARVATREPEPVEATVTPLVEATDLSALTKADLVEIADQRGIDSTGTKAEILERLSDG